MSEAGHIQRCRDLLQSIREGNLDKVKEITAAGDIDVLIYDRQTALMNAIGRGQQEIALYLIDAGSNVNWTDLEGWSPLLYAVSMQNSTIINALIKAGANPLVVDSFGQDALQIHLQDAPYDKGKQDQLLIFKTLYALLKNEAESRVYKTNGSVECRLFHLAAHYCRVQEVQYLISEGWDIHQKDENGLTSLHHAALSRPDSGHANASRIEMLQCLIQNGVNLTSKTKENKMALGLLKEDPRKKEAYNFLKTVIKAQSEKEALLKATAPPNLKEEGALKKIEHEPRRRKTKSL